MENKGSNAIKATVWSFLERISTQIVSFLIGVVLARLLTPNDYGVVGLTVIFIALSNVFIDAGFANALIRKKERTQRDLSTAFFFNIIVGLVVYLILWISSPFIASFFEEPLLVILLRIVGLNVIFSSLCVVQTAILTANLNIRLQTIINLCSQIPSGLIAIGFAYKGFGVYALALQTVLAALFRTILLWIFSHWRPSRVFDRESFQYLWSFGSKLLGANLIGTFFNQIYSILIGKYIGKNELGYYSKASHLNENVVSVGNGIVQKVALPVLSKYQDNLDILRDKFREIMRLLVMVIAPLSAFLCFSARDIVIFLWTDKWLFSAVLFQLLIVSSMWIPIGSLSLILMQAMNRSDLVLKLEFPKKAVFAVIIAVGFYFGIIGLMIGQILVFVIAALVNMYVTKRILTYNYWAQLKDVCAYMVYSYPIAWIISLLISTSHPLLNITLCFIIQISAYTTVLYIIKDSIFMKYFMLISTKIHKR